MSAAEKKCTEAPSGTTNLSSSLYKSPTHAKKKPPTLSQSGVSRFRRAPLKAHPVTHQIDTAVTPYRS